MRYRALNAVGDATFGASQANFLVNSPETVAQAVLTRLKLLKGEWFLDTTAGMAWKTGVIGVRTRRGYDRAIRDCITGTQGVRSIIGYSSSLAGRALTVTVKIDTIHGPTTVSEVL